MKKYLSVVLVAILAFAGVRFVFAQGIGVGTGEEMANTMMNEEANETMNEETNETMNEEAAEKMDEVKDGAMEAKDTMEKDASAPVEAAEKKMGY